MRHHLIAGREVDVKLQRGTWVRAQVGATGETPAFEPFGVRVVAAMAKELRPVSGKAVRAAL